MPWFEVQKGRPGARLWNPMLKRSRVQGRRAPGGSRAGPWPFRLRHHRGSWSIAGRPDAEDRTPKTGRRRPDAEDRTPKTGRRRPGAKARCRTMDRQRDGSAAGGRGAGWAGRPPKPAPRAAASVVAEERVAHAMHGHQQQRARNHLVGEACDWRGVPPDTRPSGAGGGARSRCRGPARPARRARLAARPARRARLAARPARRARLAARHHRDVTTGGRQSASSRAASDPPDASLPRRLPPPTPPSPDASLPRLGRAACHPPDAPATPASRRTAPASTPRSARRPPGCSGSRRACCAWRRPGW